MDPTLFPRIGKTNIWKNWKSIFSYTASAHLTTSHRQLGYCKLQPLQGHRWFAHKHNYENNIHNIQLFIFPFFTPFFSVFSILFIITSHLHLAFAYSTPLYILLIVYCVIFHLLLELLRLLHVQIIIKSS